MSEYLQYTLDAKIPWNITKQVIASGGGPLRFGKAMDVSLGQWMVLWYHGECVGMAPVIYLDHNKEGNPVVFYGEVVPLEGEVEALVVAQGGAPSSARGGCYLPMRKDAVVH